MLYILHNLAPGTYLYYGSAKFKLMNKDRSMFGKSTAKFPSDINFFISNRETAMGYSSPYEDSKEYFGTGEDAAPNTNTESNLNVYVTKGPSTYIVFNHPANIRRLLYEDMESPFNYANREKYTYNGDLRISGVAGGNNAKRSIVDYLRTEKYINRPDIERGILIPEDIDKSMFGFLLVATNYYKGEDHIERYSTYAFDFQIASLFKAYFEPKGINGWWQPKEAKFHEEYLIFSPDTVLDKVSDDDTIPQLRMFIDKLDNADEEFTQDVSVQEIAEKLQNRVRKYAARKHKCHIPSLCETPLTFEGMGQRSLSEIYEEMLQYTNASNIHHVGKTVADHSIWVTRTIYNWMAYQEEPWTAGIWPEFRETTLLAAYLHDIGKIGDLDRESLPTRGDKPQHPAIGYQYLTGKKEFRRLQKSCTNFIECFKLNIPKDVFPVIAGVVAMHHHFGELLIRYSMYTVTPTVAGDIKYQEKFDFAPYIYYYGGLIGSIYSTIVELKYIIFLHHLYKILKEHDNDRIYLDNKDNLEQLLRILCAVGAADTFGSYPVETSEGNSRYSRRVAKILDPHVIFHETSTSRNVIEIYRPYYKFAYGLLGFAERDKLIEYARAVVDYDGLSAAWDGFQQYNECIKNNKMDDVPGIYKTLPRDSPNTYLTALLRLLKIGSTSLSESVVQRYQPREDADYHTHYEVEDTTAKYSWGRNISAYLLTHYAKLSPQQFRLLQKFRNHRIEILRPGEASRVVLQQEQQMLQRRQEIQALEHQKAQRQKAQRQKAQRQKAQRQKAQATGEQSLEAKALAGTINVDELATLISKYNIEPRALVSEFARNYQLKKVVAAIKAASL